MHKNDKVKLKIGSVVFSISGWRDPVLQGEFMRVYQDYMSESKPEVHYRLHWGKNFPLRLSDNDGVFRSISEYTYYRPKGSGTILSINLPGSTGKPFLHACFSPRYDRCEIYASEDNFYKALGENAFPFLEVMLSNVLSLKKGVILHSCGIVDKGYGYLFAGKSGNGKSTMARLWEKEATVLSDERVMVLRQDRQFVIMGIPRNTSFASVPPVVCHLTKIFFIEHASALSDGKMLSQESFTQLMLRSSLPLWDKLALKNVMALLQSLSLKVPCFRLGFLPDSSVIDYVRAKAASSGTNLLA